MVFSSLLKTGNDQRRHRRLSSSGSPGGDTSPSPSQKSSVSHEETPYIASEAQLEDVESEPPELTDLNNSLAALAAIFPDVQVEVFREMLSSFDEESRLAVVTEALIKNKMKWSRGRYKVLGKEAAQKTPDDDVEVLPKEERFRTAEYKLAVKNAAYNEFKGLSHSTVKAVLAEHNHSFIRARPTLAALHAKSWRFSITAIFSRKKANPEQNQFIVWHSTGLGSIIPTLKSSGCVELDRELFESFIKPLQVRSQAEQIEKDHTLALELNTEQAEEADSMHDCECCYTSTTFEELSACNDGAHFVCFQCIRHAAKEAVFGQGWARSVDSNIGSLRCLAPVSDECHGCIPQELVNRALLGERGGADVIRKFNERLAEDNILKSQLPLVRCPFCSYAEIDEIYLPETQKDWNFRHHSRLSLFSLAVFLTFIGMIPFLIPFIALALLAAFVASFDRNAENFARRHIIASYTRLRRNQRGLRFQCQNEDCLRYSCISCSKAWTDIHICHESSLLALRTQVELAMSLAIKRTCPRCNTSFVKSSGCNKLTCVCGYQMCYVCRKDIGSGEGYRHFCEHFRPNGGKGCTECEKCDLYRCENDEVVVTKAKEDAERLWFEKEGAGDEDLKKTLVQKYDPAKDGWIGRVWRSRPSAESVLDALMEFVIE
ncbi:hypothetical protein V490_04633 [Pseudogymnoascus sp. VKM F-3557]|nr:hypothetical protein V490_04633 [Pseudogymnoascus sp. VKM F-3557]